jgi:uncharacterized protein YbcI
MGRGPTRASVTVGRDVVVCRLRDVLTPTERLLVATGRDELVSETREVLAELARPAIRSAVAGLTGRAVRSTATTLDVGHDTAVETVVLAPGRVRERPRRRPAGAPSRARDATRGSAASTIRRG